MGGHNELLKTPAPRSRLPTATLPEDSPAGLAIKLRLVTLVLRVYEVSVVVALHRPTLTQIECFAFLLYFSFNRHPDLKKKIWNPRLNVVPIFWRTQMLPNVVR